MDAGASSSTTHGRIVPGTFRPHPLLGNPHFQTLFPGLFRPTPPLHLQVERWELPDGDFLELGGFGEGRGPLVLLLHGLTGGFESKYARGLARHLMRAGWRGAILQFRGAGAEPNRLPRGYHHGETGDVRAVLGELHRREPGTPLYAVGWSLGANVLLKYLGESGPDTPVAGAVAVCAPFQLRPCAERLRTGFSRVYQYRLLRELKRMVRRKFAARPGHIDLKRAGRARDFFEFDDAVTAPLHGFENAEDYYARSSCGQFLRTIAVPTLIINSRDDPFMPPDVVPDASRLSRHVTLELCERGGHVGFLAAARNGLPEFWLERRIAEHLVDLNRNGARRA